jgi:hypothetical protein
MNTLPLDLRYARVMAVMGAIVRGALDVLQLGDRQKIQDDITELKLLLEVVSAS